jgi:FtsP/CotA-like multicopper oxidase with cupredoxin domain
MKNQQRTFNLNPLAAAVMMATASMIGINLAHANGNGGFGLASDGVTPVQTFYANSYVAQGFNSVNDGSGLAVRGLRKFIDTLPGIPGVSGVANNLGQYIPSGAADKSSYPGSDYYEVAVVEYAEKMHSDLLKATTLRGYVQIDRLATNSGGLTPSAGSKAVALKNLDGTAIQLYKENADHSLVSPLTLVQAFAYDNPHYLGPTLIATRGTAIRMKFVNALPAGRLDSTGKRTGDIFLPVDETLTGAGFGPDGVTKYTQNRVALHWHGGDTPWISDGTPHQWIVPAADEASLPTAYKRGASQANASDMPDPGPGAETLYYPNNLSARLMFYHDHALGVTRLNVYAGMAAGYIIQDPVEQALVTAGTIPATQIPLIIQEKTFVPNDIAMEDGLWDTAHWGTEGDLWYPHVYETNQDPSSVDGTNPVGRWDYGPWFWPVFPAPLALPTGAYGDVTTTPEAFMDTPIVNGTAYPKIDVPATAVRLRILNATNDRMLNLAFYVADSTLNSTVSGTAANTEVKMVPFNGPNGPTQVTYACPDGSAAGLNVGDINALGAVTQLGWTESGPNNAGVTLYNNSFPCAGGLQGTGWGNQDGRPGGVPDPKFLGPDMIQIGTEGGILPNPVVIPSTVANFEYNKRSVTVLNVYEHGLFLGSAERADVIVDFSAYAGKTLILYNDSPAPTPAGDPRIDYYTNNGDQTGAGGAPSTLPGFGPNTRTVMQFNVAATGATPAYKVAALQAALPVAYKASQEAPLVPESAYNNAFGTADGDNFATIYAGSSIQPNFIYTPTTTVAQTLQSIAVTGQGAGYTVAPNVVLSGAGLTAAVTIAPVAGVTGAQVAGGKVISVIVDATALAAISAAGGVHSAPKVAFVSNVKPGSTMKVGTGATAQALTDQSASLPVRNKAIQELFDPSYGRMNATLGVELPFTSPLNQTTIPLGFIDPTTEYLADGQTEVWKITHNGVDSHPVHFHLVNLQVLNRVGWDGTIKPPYDNEQGWKETIRMNPLEDIYVAVKPRVPQIPFGVRESVRAMDPSQPIGSITGFTQVDPMTGVAPIDPLSGLTTQITNKLVSYGWEYVWHCHILGHEENDFMRPISFAFGAVVPSAPTGLTVTGFTANAVSNPVLTWVDPTPAATAAGNKQNEIGFTIKRAPAGSSTFTTVGTTLANAQTFTDKLAPSATGYTYQVIAFNSAGNSAPVATNVGAAVASPAPLNVATLSAAVNGPYQVTLTWKDMSGAGTGAAAVAETSFIIQRAVVTGLVTGAYATIASAPAHTGVSGNTSSRANPWPTFVDTTAQANTAYSYKVIATNNGTNATGTNPVVSATTPVAPNLTAPTNVMVQMTGTNAETISFTDLATAETRYYVQVSTDSGKSWGDGTNTTFTQTAPAYLATANRNGAQSTGSGAAVSVAINNGANLALTSGNSPYIFRVAAATSTVVGAWGNTAALDLSGMTVIGAPTAVTATATAGGATLTWVDNANNNASYLLQKSTDAGVTWTNTGVTLAGAATSATVTGLTTVPTVFRLQAVSLGTTSSSFATSNVVTPLAPPAPATPTGFSATRGGFGNPITASLAWTAPASATSYQVVWSTSATGLNAVTGAANPVTAGGNAGVNVISPVTANPYTYTAAAGIVSGATVYFKIRAVNGSGSSAWTAVTNSTVR